jgi:hypothetical protein
MPSDYDGARFQRYELTGRQILVYLGNLSNGKPLTFTYRLQAKFPLTVQSPSSTVYDYYNPQIAGEEKPVRLVVEP